MQGDNVFQKQANITASSSQLPPPPCHHHLMFWGTRRSTNICQDYFTIWWFSDLRFASFLLSRFTLGKMSCIKAGKMAWKCFIYILIKKYLINVYIGWMIIISRVLKWISSYIWAAIPWPIVWGALLPPQSWMGAELLWLSVCSCNLAITVLVGPTSNAQIARY